MDRLAEQVVAWHNSHPLAKRISIYDVHTIGVVALPFMRSSAGVAVGDGEARGPIEPVLTDAVSTESLAAWGTEESTLAANTNAAHLDALADQEEPPASVVATSSWRERLLRLFKRDGSVSAAGNGGRSWPAFSERFVDGLSPRRIAAFAKKHGYSTRPGDATWPHRVIAIDDQLMSGKGAVGGAWPFELYLMSAAIDAGRSRSRVLVGRSGTAAKPPFLGRRCLSPQRVGMAASVVVGVIGMGTVFFLPRSASHDMLAGPVAASAAGSAPASAVATAMAASMPASMPLALAASAPASEALSMAFAASGPSSAAASSPVMADAAASAPSEIPDIRPHFVESARPAGYKGPPLHVAEATPVTGASSSKEKESAGKPAAEPPARSASAAPTAVATADKPAPGPVSLPVPTMKPDVKEAALSGAPVVALVAPPTRNKAEAQATLDRMRELVAPLQADPKLIQAQLFESPEGWRPAVWPFATRVEAQLINATLVARGLHTKAVNF